MLPPYRNPFTEAIAQQMGVPAQAQAEAVRVGGQASANAWGSVAQGASNVMGDLLKYKMDEPRRQSQALDLKLKTGQVQDDEQERQDRAQMDDAMRVSGGDPEMALTILSRRGAIGVGARAKLQAQVAQQRRAGEQSMLTHLETAHKQVSLVSQQVQGIQALPPEERPSAYAAALPAITEAVGPELAKRFPPEYDPKAINNLLTAGQTLTQHMESRKLAIEDAKFARDEAKDAREQDEYFTKALGGWLSTTGNEEEWQQVRKLAEAPKENGGYGVPPATLKKFPEHWSPEAVSKADTFSLTAAERNARIVRAGTEEDAVVRYARELGKPVKDLSQKEVNNALARRAYALQNHEVGGSKLPAAERQRYVETVLKNPEAFQKLSRDVQSAIAPDLAERGFNQFGVPDLATKVRLDALRRREFEKIETEFKAGSVPSPSGEMRPAMTPEERDARKLAVVNDIREMQGLEPVDTLPGAKPTAPAKTKVATPPPTSAPTTPAPAATAGVPPEVTTLLTGKKPGIYPMTDGSRYMVGRDGSITRAAAR